MERESPDATHAPLGYHPVVQARATHDVVHVEELVQMPSSRRSETREPPHVSALSCYLRDISAYRLLNRDQEVQLALRIRAGDETALEKLVCSNLRFVVAVAKKYQNQGVSLEDLINEGNVGLIRAAQRFDETRGTKFISYAVWWIRQAILEALAAQSRIVRVPINRALALHRVGKRANVLRQELGREPTVEEIADEMTVSEREVANTMTVARAPLSLDAPFASTDDGKLLDYVADEVTPAPDADLVEDVRVNSVREALSRLRPREATVLTLYFGIGGIEPQTLEQIGARLGITRERVRQIKEKSLWRMRKSTNARALAALRE